MSTVRTIGSALKRAALYVPRKIVNIVRPTKIAITPIQNMPDHCAKISIKGKRVKEVRVYKRGIIPPIAKNIAHIENEDVGPFAAMSTKCNWPTHDQGVYFPPPGIRIQDERIGPFAYTTLKDSEQVDISAGAFVQSLSTGAKIKYFLSFPFRIKRSSTLAERRAWHQIGTRTLKTISLTTLGAAPLLYVAGVLTPLSASMAVLPAALLLFLLPKRN